MHQEEEQNPEQRTKSPAQRHRMKRKQEINLDQQEANQLPVTNQEGTNNAKWKTVKKKSTRHKLAKVAPEAIIIKIIEEKSYANTLKSLKKGPNDAGLTDEVEMSKSTMNGDLLLKLKKENK